jgi:hypothetical protein
MKKEVDFFLILYFYICISFISSGEYFLLFFEISFAETDVNENNTSFIQATIVKYLKIKQGIMHSYLYFSLIKSKGEIKKLLNHLKSMEKILSIRIQTCNIVFHYLV